jgi:hypothetical protein
MKRLLLAIVSCLLAFPPQTLLSAEATDKHKADSNQGITFEDIGRGLKSAAKNIGDEIPKIGPAIADTFKKVTGSENSKDHDSSSTSPAKSGPAKEQKK